MKSVGRVFHDNSIFSKANYRLENGLRITTLSFLNSWLIPALMRYGKDISPALKTRFMNQVVVPYVRGSYTLGSNYVARIADRELTSSTNDSEKISDIMVKSFDEFWERIDKFRGMEQTSNRKGYQFIAEQKEIIASEFASQATWKAFNQGIISKGFEYKSDLAENNRLQLDIINRDIRTEDLKGVRSQLIYMDRKQDDNRERTSQTLPVSMPRLEAFLRARQELKGELVFVLITQRDELVCEECRSLETQFWLSGDPTIPDVPVHPNCRCRLALAENEFEQ